MSHIQRLICGRQPFTVMCLREMSEKKKAIFNLSCTSFPMQKVLYSVQHMVRKSSHKLPYPVLKERKSNLFQISILPARRAISSVSHCLCPTQFYFKVNNWLAHRQEKSCTFLTQLFGVEQLISWKTHQYQCISVFSPLVKCNKI